MPKVVAYVPRESVVHSIVEAQSPAGWNVVILDPPTTSVEDLHAAVSDADFLMFFYGKITPEILRAGKNLRLAQSLHAGTDDVPVSVAGELGIAVANASGTNSQGVAELALTLMLALYRHLVWADSALRKGDWMVDRAVGHDSYEIEGKTVGIVGLGNIGSITARLVKGFNTKILYTDIDAKPEAEKAFGAVRVDLDHLLSESDIVTLHTPLDESTHGMIGRNELALMKRSAILINTCRGPVVQEDALLEVLRGRRIWGAGLDVYEQEPTPPNNPLLQLDNVVVVPHLAGQTYESYPRRVGIAFANMQKVLSVAQPQNLVIRV
ncbi:MAG: 2-hydroxyacid dehydrogenase [Chloroflexi bacterium]|nr:2-hydroxyacid dehydrogenase [Chloroflexota bacterium]